VNGTFNLRDNIADLALLATPFLVLWVWFWLRLYGAASWPKTEGRIESGEVSVARGKSGETATATLRYSYQVEGEYYAGSHEQYFNDEQRAWDCVDGAKGRTVQVRYHPRQLEKSMLRAEDQAGL
jgi:Protein of unknown function (DUF3592)